MKRILLCAVLAFAARASGQPQEKVVELPPLESQATPTTENKLPDTLPLVAVTWVYDAQQEMLNLRLTNNSGKDITAYSMTVSRRYSNRSTGYTDGSPSVSETMEEMGFINGAVFATGTSRNQHMPEPKDITDVKAVVDMVVFADATAYVQNERAFRQLMAMRKGQLMAMQKVDEIIKGVLADSSVGEPIAQVTTELIPLAFAPRGKLERLGSRPEDPEGNQQIELQNTIRNLQLQQSNSNEREFLARYEEENEKRIAVMKPHCEVVVVK